MISDADPTILYQAHLPSKAWPLGHVRRFEHPSRLVHVGDDAIVIDTLGVRKGWHAFGRYYGFLDRWLSVFVTFDINDLSLTSYPKSEFPFASDSDINVSLYDPHGFEVGRWDRLESHSGVQHIAERNGVYVLRFDNSFSLFTSKRVSVTMRVVPPNPAR